MSICKINRRQFLRLIPPAAAAAALAGCGAAASSGAASTAASTASSAASAASEGTTEVTFWSLFTGDDGTVMDSIVDQFNKSQTAVHVSHIAMEATTDLYVKLPMVANDDAQAPDLCVVHNNYIPYLVEKGALQPITTITDNFDNLAEDNFNSADMTHYKDERYGAILDFPSAILYGNKDLIAKYYPEIADDNVITWDEIFALGDKLKAAGVINDIKPLVSSWARNDILQSLITSGGDYSKDGTTLSLTADQMVTAIEKWKELNDKGYFMTEDADALGMFALGQAVFVTGGTWNLTAVKGYGFDFEMLPHVQYSADGDIVTYAVAHCFTMPQRTFTDAKIKAVGTFISWFEDNAMLWANSGAIVSYKKAADSSDFAALPQSQVDKAGTIHRCSSFLYTSICDETINKYGWQPVYGHLTPEDYGKTVVSEIESQIAAQ